MKDYDSKRKIAKDINEVLVRMYNNCHLNFFDENIDFSGIPSTTLKDFWLYTSGFIGFKNNDELESLVSEEEIQSILAGKFILKYLTNEQLDVIAKRSGVEIEDGDKPQIVPLYTIQDGTYYINKNIVNPKTGEPTSYISLVTNPVELHTDTPQDYVNPKFVLRMLRNTFAHESPYIKGNKLTFLKMDDEIVLSKMWLRGYTELFARKTAPYTSAELYDMLYPVLKDAKNDLTSLEDVFSAVTTIFPYLDKKYPISEMLTKYLIQERINLEKNFFKRDFESKLQSFCSIISNNFSMFNAGRGKVNSNLLYGLVNLVGVELQERKEEAPLDETDPDVIAFASILEQLSSLKKGAKIIASLKSMSGNGRALKRNQEKQSYLTAQANEYIKIINPKKVLECTHMDEHTIEDMKHLPVEMAVNIVYLLAYNSLVSSCLYEETLRYSNFAELTPAQQEFFNQFEFGNIIDNSTIPGQKDKPLTNNPGRKAFVLYSMRNALCHGNINFSYPKIRENYHPDFRSIRIRFNCEKQNITVSGSLKDFYNLFTSPLFTQERSPEIITTFDREKINEAENRRKNKQTVRTTIPQKPSSSKDENAEPGEE